MHDVWISICHGNNPHISVESFDTPELNMADMASDEQVMGVGNYVLEEGDRGFGLRNALRFLETAKMTMVLWGVLKET